MSEAISPSYDVPTRRVRSPAMAGAVGPAPHGSIRRAQTLDIGLDRPSSCAERAWQVREDQPFYVPDVLSDRSYNTDAELYDAADEHADNLRKAQRNLEDVLNLARVLLESFGDDGDSRALQAATVLKIVDRKLNKALNRLDRHDSRHRNLFFAYFDREEEA